MNFYERQERARRASNRLYVMFALLVVITILATYFSVVLALGLSEIKPEALPHGYWNKQIFGYVFGGVSLIMLFGYLQKLVTVGSGEAVANYYGGRIVALNTTEPKERQLLNIVEEMSIASGVPIPSVYILDEQQGLNAFAAGKSPQTSVIAVTKGALENLNRDELQGVIGHEFSHVYNLDMALNLKILGIIGGFFAIFGVGKLILNSMARGSRGRSSKKGGGGVQIALFGIALCAVGFFGIMMGRVLQAAFSRQREILADATATQFTRNPLGLAAALRKIKTFDLPSDLRHGASEDVAHMMFYASSFMGMFNTHPSIDERIKALDRYGSTEGVKFEFKPQAKPIIIGKVEQKNFVNDIVAASVISSLPNKVDELSREALGAQAIILGILLNHGQGGIDLESAQDELGKYFSAEIIRELRLALPEISALDRRQSYVMVEKSCWALSALSNSQAKEFIQALEKICFLDHHFELFELAVMIVVKKQLRRKIGNIGIPERKSKLINYVKDIELLFSLVAREGYKEKAGMLAAKGMQPGAKAMQGANEMQMAYEISLNELSIKPSPVLNIDTNTQTEKLAGSIERLSLSSTDFRRMVMMAAEHLVLSNQQVNDEEYEILRMLSLSFGIPVNIEVAQ